MLICWYNNNNTTKKRENIGYFKTKSEKKKKKYQKRENDSNDLMTGLFKLARRCCVKTCQTKNKIIFNIHVIYMLNYDWIMMIEINITEINFSMSRDYIFAEIINTKVTNSIFSNVNCSKVTRNCRFLFIDEKFDGKTMDRMYNIIHKNAII